MRGFLRSVWGLIVWIGATPFLVLGWYYSRGERFFMASLLVAYLPLKLGESIRQRYYSCLLNELGSNVRFKFGSYCQYPDIKIGANSVIGLFSSVGLADIGQNVHVGGYVNFLSGRKQHEIVGREYESGRRRISIGDGSWIGSNSVIMNDVGDNSTVGAGSVVVKPVGNSEVVAGNPAKTLKSEKSNSETDSKAPHV